MFMLEHSAQAISELKPIFLDSLVFLRGKLTALSPVSGHHGNDPWSLRLDRPRYTSNSGALHNGLSPT